MIDAARIVFVLATIADVYLTRRNLQAGGVEINPLLAWAGKQAWIAAAAVSGIALWIFWDTPLALGIGAGLHLLAVVLMLRWRKAAAVVLACLLVPAVAYPQGVEQNELAQLRAEVQTLQQQVADWKSRYADKAAELDEYEKEATRAVSGLRGVVGTLDGMLVSIFEAYVSGGDLEEKVSAAIASTGWEPPEGEVE